jgi:hypothetical protein
VACIGEAKEATEVARMGPTETLLQNTLKFKALWFGDVWEYYHFLNDFATPMVGLLRY